MTSFRKLALLTLALPLAGSLAAACFAQDAGKVGGQDVVTLSRKAVSTTKPEFTSVTVLPGRGMEVLYVTANFPGKGNVDVFASPDLAASKKMLDVEDDDFGDLGYRLGSAFLFPYPNRIRGKLSEDGKTLTTEWNGRSITIPANNIGSAPGGERHAMHGLILKAKTDDVQIKQFPGGQEVTGVIHAGDFAGQWFSKSDLDVSVRLTADALDVNLVAKNVGKESEPVAIAWHPYFNLPSGDRTQVKVEIPASTLAEVDGYNNVFPTGKVLPVAGTRFDLTAKGGVALGSNFYDDNWNTIAWKNGAATVRVIDPKAGYGIAIEGLSPEIKAIQMYAPPTKQFVAIEHQYNYGDPFGKEWGKIDTGMVTLKPGESTKWHVRLKVFVP